MGDAVRYDGTGAKSSMPHDALAGLFDWQPICPEVGIGMSVPREPIRLVGTLDDYRVVGVKDRRVDNTAVLKRYADSQIEQCRDFAGYVFMHNSPSCGLFRVKVYPENGGVGTRGGRGIYAAGITGAIPDMPVEEAGRLHDPVLRENFVTRVFAYGHWQRVVLDLTPARLIAFHSAYKYLLMAHSGVSYQQAGRLLSDLKTDFANKAERYIALLMNGLRSPATRKSHANVMAHLQGYLKKAIPSGDRIELDRLIQAYRRGEQPLEAALALLRHHFRRHPNEYIEGQVYLDPHPRELGLRRNL